MNTTPKNSKCKCHACSRHSLDREAPATERLKCGDCFVCKACRTVDEADRTAILKDAIRALKDPFIREYCKPEIEDLKKAFKEWEEREDKRIKKMREADKPPSTPPKEDDGESKKYATLYKGNFKEEEIVFTRVWAMPSPWTFEIHPVKVLLEKYVGDGKGWVDPFAGKFSPAEITNDNNPERNAKFCMEAIDFAQQLIGRYNGVLFDPPYSFTQIKEHYQNLFGRKLRGDEHRMGFYEKVKSSLCEKIKSGGYAISFGWNSNGFGKARGFKIVEIMNIAHGGSKNDTIATVEVKL